MTGLPLDFPIALRLQGRPVLVVGGGKISSGRVRQLLEVGADVHLVSPELSPALDLLAGRIRVSRRPFRPGDVGGAFVVFAATNDPQVNRAVAEEARSLGVLVNVADEPELCDFYVPSIGRRGPVTIAVSTAGQAPGLARTLRQRALQAVGPEYGRLARLIGRLRRVLPAGAHRTRALEALVEGGAASKLAAGDRRGVWRLVRSVVTPEARPPTAMGREEGLHP